MINDIRHFMNWEQPLDAWLLGVIAVVNDAAYEIILQLTKAQDGVDENVC